MGSLLILDFKYIYFLVGPQIVTMAQQYMVYSGLFMMIDYVIFMWLYDVGIETSPSRVIEGSLLWGFVVRWLAELGTRRWAAYWFFWLSLVFTWSILIDRQPLLSWSERDTSAGIEACGQIRKGLGDVVVILMMGLLWTLFVVVVVIGFHYTS